MDGKALDRSHELIGGPNMAVSAKSAVIHNGFEESEERRAVRSLTRQLKDRPENVTLRTELASSLMQLKRYRAAADTLEHVVDADRAGLDVRVMLAECLYLSGDFQDCIDQVEEIFDEAPDHPRTMIIAAAAHRALSDIRFEEGVTRDASMGVFSEIFIDYYDGLCG